MATAGGLELDGGAPARHRTESEQLTRRLLEAAAEEFLAHGYEASRVSIIARRSGVTTGSIYTRWSSKSDLLVAALEHVLNQVLPEQRLKGFGAAGSEPDDMIGVLGASLVANNDLRDVMVQAFGSARPRHPRGGPRRRPRPRSGLATVRRRRQ